MGNKGSTFHEEPLSEDLMKVVKETFAIFDADGSKNIDKNEAIKHWKTGFGKLSAKEFFDQVDFDGNGQISEEEFVRFWKIVKGCGHDENEIIEELNNIKNGELWVGFDDVPNMKKAANRKD